MGTLTARSLRLKHALEERGRAVIEIYPGAAQGLSSIGRQQKGLSSLRRGLEGLGLEGLAERMNSDELYAVSGTPVEPMCLFGRAELPGNPAQRVLVVPKPSSRRAGARPGR